MGLSRILAASRPGFMLPWPVRAEAGPGRFKAVGGGMGSSENRYLLTNDDGIDAEGLAALRSAVEGLGPIAVVAPSEPQSGCGHVVTTDRPFRVESRGPAAYAVEGTPADCVRMAVHHLLPEIKWVLSGINSGGNLGADVFHSGTVAAAREAALHGLPALAVSQYMIRSRPLDWSRSARLAREAIDILLAEPIEAGSFWNVNLPHLMADEPDPPLVRCGLDPSPLPLLYKVEGESAAYIGSYPDRERKNGSDVDVCFSGRISATLLRLC